MAGGHKSERADRGVSRDGPWHDEIVLTRPLSQAKEPIPGNGAWKWLKRLCK